MQLKNLVFTLRQYLAEDVGTMPSVGHTYELLASLMGYDTFASLNSQAFLLSLRGSHYDMIENVRILLAGHPDRQGAAKRHEALSAPGDAWKVARSLEKFASEHELVAIPLETLLDNPPGTGADPWSTFAFDELMKGMVTISQGQLALALSMLEDACKRELRLRPPLIRLYRLLQECFDSDAGLSTSFKERAEFHNRAQLAAGMPKECSLLPIDPWCPAYGSAHGVATYSPEVNRGLAAATIIKSILPHDPHTIWVTHNGTQNHLAGAGFTNVSLTLPHISQTPRVCLNPFVANGESIGLEDRMAIAHILHLMMSSVSPDFCTEHPQLLQVLQEALYDFYRGRERHVVTREPTMRDFIASLDDFVWQGLEGSEISLALAPFCGGGRYAGLFDGNFDLGIESDWVLFDTKAIEGTPALAPAILVLALKIDAECRHRIPRTAKKALILSHDWVSHSSTRFTVPFSHLYKSFRRYNLGALVLSESLSEYLSLQDDHPDNELADGLLANTSHSFALISKARGHAVEYSSFTYERPV